MREYLQSAKKRFWQIYNFLTHEDELFVYASSLSFYTIFALIPLLLIISSILIVLPNFQEKFGEFRSIILQNVLPAHLELITQWIDSFISNGSKMGIVGFVYIIFASIMFFRNYEYITSKMFNSTVRKFFNSISLFWTLITLFPLVLGISFYFAFQFKGLWEEGILSVLMPLSPIIVGWFMFLLLFKISANKEMAFKALFLASALTSLCWNIAKWVFVYYIYYNQSYVSIYGSLSFVLFGMLWVYVSWFIVLFGMRICEGLNQKFYSHS
ncbi:YihY family inner membrane protein [Helicobacter cholecystus]|uniref:YihY family inner membrane protein n=1 Tax=Helicobacter cholecystus TaxID=45498 RepID=A0A3D8IW40_9HELI|nr:YihY family inner membrane protein [Helicobacter cholecystus]RDU69442.1 YihY family inner membrane protein [Helicobacter cholecystus]VEJ23992.1 tRNA-processing ribonuclease BN [Helicobacter cholecystus]